MQYFDFIIKEWRFLFFGISLNFFSSTGQTFFISIFGAEFKNDFGLSDGDFGFLFMVATLLSALSLIWFGRLIDRVDLRLYTSFVCIGSIIASLSTSIATSAIMLCFSFYLLRLMGQGLMNHIAVTSMGKYFSAGRGKAIGIITFGMTLGLAFYPSIGVWLKESYGWRDSWLFIAIFYSIMLLPLMLWLLKGQKNRHKLYIEKLAIQESTDINNNQYSVRSMLSELQFYLTLPAILSSSFLLTGLLFHQVTIVESKNWSISIFASGFVGLAVASFLTSLVIGILIDKFKAINLLPFILAPLIFGLFVVNYFQSELFGFVYLICLGCCFGTTFTISGAIWPELYGTKNLGAIKSLIKAIMVCGSALSPWLFGLVLDAGFGLLGVSYISVAIISLTSILAIVSRNITINKLAQQ
ncbi:MAG: MFS transporter [Rhodospirillales bacterium]